MQTIYEYSVGLEMDMDKLTSKPIFAYECEPESIVRQGESLNNLEKFMEMTPPIDCDKIYLIMQVQEAGDIAVEVEISPEQKEEIMTRNKAAMKARNARKKLDAADIASWEAANNTKWRASQRWISRHLSDEQTKEESLQNVYVRNVLYYDSLDIILYLVANFKHTDIRIIDSRTAEIAGTMYCGYENEEGKFMNRRVSRERFSKQTRHYYHRYI